MEFVMQEAEIYFNFLLHMVAADGVVDANEVEFIKSSMQSIGLAGGVEQRISDNLRLIESGGKLQGLETLYSSISKSKNPNIIMTLIRDGFALASSDGDLAPEETNLIESLLASVGNHDEGFIDEVLAWAKNSLAVKIKGEELLEGIIASRGAA